MTSSPAPSLIELLKGSEAFKSIQAEQRVAALLKNLRWQTTQSPYYLDEKTRKLREIDVGASKYWRKKRKSDEIGALVHVLIEVKSNGDHHVLLGGRTAKPFGFGSNNYWIGYSRDTYQVLEECLARFDLPREEVFDFLHRVEKFAFPRNSMRTAALRVAPPPVEACFSAFRETNGKTEKDLDNSVLWRATTALRSAVGGSQRTRIENLAVDVRTDLEVARRRGEPFHTWMGPIERHACRVDLYLPVVVIESRIWSTTSSSPEELKWARLVQHGTVGGEQDWVDVVNAAHIEEYLRMQSKFFDAAFRRVGAKPW